MLLIPKPETWVQKYFNLAQLVSSWSKDPSKKIGAVAVGTKGQILATGYNGFPRGIEDSEERLNDRETKYKFVVHAEQNCIYNATLNGISLDSADMYIWGLPLCSECAKGVIQVGIKRVFMCYPSDIPDKWKESFETTKAMLIEAEVDYIDIKADHEIHFENAMKKVRDAGVSGRHKSVQQQKRETMHDSEETLSMDE